MSGVELRPASDDAYFQSVDDEQNMDMTQSSPWLTNPEELEAAKALRVAKDLRESSRIFMRSNEERQNIKAALEADVERKYVSRQLQKKEMLVDWGRKLERSPFLVDQVAEAERIDEEHRVKLQEEARRQKLFEQRKQKIKTEIILKALVEANDLESLRQEKRLINEEERKLKAKRDLEKRMKEASKKDEIIAQQCADRKRRNEQLYMQQQQRYALQEAESERRREALLQKLQAKYGDIPGEQQYHTASVKPFKL
mmetsp:Transcript_13585/g.31304  ORF Transcript_13585/g.31304 Transcript_13585/m.31304 type:complete len:255 (-) Transcript_13585:108-872(-)|eukprot:CAMPEP_0114559606 /NCGR_PEP_ID=MMETSP0114-20121206/11011_1 /TAXON_ID=31324 /ORGANISM="Goniomonas sp, Strain m" /LENGTH=254 /DNA_ID=CAMNT_0001745087 /DNA_START=31 /DNA_END=795 /DNA_ORIENTATION=+